MKNKTLNKFCFLLAIFFIVACSEERPITSEITFFPTFEVSGDQYMTIEQGSTFTDPGAIALAGDGTLPVTTSGSVNTSTLGVYKLEYKATNVDGFEGSAFRYVAVVDDLAAITSNDLSGSYTRDSNTGHVMTLTKLGGAFYDADDVLPTNKINVFIVQVSSTELIAPRQSSRFGDIVIDPSVEAGSSGTILATGDITLQTYIGCCGVFTRRFLKN
ncbi:DUF5011 domain-containing protein [Thalassobellus suaedae]|uniref:DUF5011 domain-containing protein n=1 Tax=Thalassobellus suaedae TaxID=3074124 RepID=A0ABY9Y586_9FLAO|nr:DUF5011 domain-containing protein [Flavobacteriaceae bacterium HL-DH10]